MISPSNNAATQAIQQFVALGNLAKAVTSKIQTEISERTQKWPPTLQDVMEKGVELRSNNLYHLITGIVNPNLGCDNHGNVRLSKTKATKVSKICDDIETLVLNVTPLSSQVLLPPNVYLKTVSSIITNDLHKMGHGILNTEIILTKDKWTEWRERQSSLIPSNIQKGVVATLVFDNIHWKNRDF